MTNHWRPESWNNEAHALKLHEQSVWYEAGADAMLGAIRMTPYPCNFSITISGASPDVSGRWVFIPEDPPVTAVKKLTPALIKHHPATETVLTGYFCPECGKAVSKGLDCEHKHGEPRGIKY